MNTERPTLSYAALRIAELTGIDPMEDVRRLRAGEVSPEDLRDECLNGVEDPDIAADWHDYYHAIVRFALPEFQG